jgi:hypothetical protein
MSQLSIPVDFSLVPPTWNAKTGKYAPTSSAIYARAREARQLIRARLLALAAAGETGDAVLVTHGGFLHFFTKDWEDSSKNEGTAWKNTEWRSYEFADLEDEEARLVETESSRLRRGKVGSGSSREEQEQFYREAMEAWERRGLQNPSKEGKRRESIGEARL